MAARARYRTTAITKELTSNLLTLLPGATVTLYEPASTTPIAATIYAAATGATTLPNPFTLGSAATIEFFLTKPQPVKLEVVLGASTITIDLEPVEADPRAKITYRNVTVDGALADGMTEAAGAIQTAINEVAAVGDGTVWIGPSATNAGYNVGSRLTVPAAGNITIMGPGRTTYAGAGVRLNIKHQDWPAILIDQAGYVRITDLSLFYDGTPTAVSTFEGDASYGGMIGLDRAGRVDLENLYVPYAYDFVACGTANNPNGSSRLTIRDCEVWVQRDGLVIRGASYLNILGTNQWENRVGQTGVAVRWRGPAHTDGALIERLFTEDFGTGISAVISDGGQVSNVLVAGCLFDGIAVAGVRLHADHQGGAIPVISKWRMANLSITGTAGSTPARGYWYSTGASGVLQGLSVFGGEVNAVGLDGVFIADPAATNRITDIHFFDLLVTYCSSQTTNTADGVVVAGNVTKLTLTGKVVGQLPIQIPGNTHHRYAVNVGSSCDNFLVNVDSVGEGTARYNQGAVHNGTSKVWAGLTPARSSVGGTTTPATTGTPGAYSTIPDLTRTITTSGGDVLAMLSISLAHPSPGASTVLAFRIDGGADVAVYAHNQDVASHNAIVTIHHLFTGVTPGSHTIDARWLASSGTTTANGTQRRLTVGELR